ncbi:MAG TPA: GntR family transcriptional regulator, partial [Candidatus Ozemobacteraceae bacterium]|nr:GntR family transcriptional regulator [Candidatus Ozemobacteraceae bacterium]
GFEKVPGIAEQILAALQQAGGFLPLTDGTAPEEIQKHFGISKKTFKKAIGTLFRERRIVIEEQGIRLVPGKEERTGKS